MTSSQQCFVHIQLPDTLDVVPCGRFALDRMDDGSRVGRFVYGRSYLSRTDAVPIDPYHLPLEDREFQTARLGGLFGGMRDATPDFWGRRVIERRLGRTDLTEFDLLVHPSSARIGALCFSNTLELSATSENIPGMLDLPALRAAAARIESGAPIADDVEDLLVPGSSLGGARPKTIIRDEGHLWVAKLPQQGDRWSHAPVEGAMLALARLCGIRTPDTRVEAVGEERVLLVRRFDREPTEGGEHRHRMVSAMTVLDLDDGVTDRSGWSYLRLADELQRWSETPKDDKKELFRRIAFNALISNIDDHPRNHALIAPAQGWRLSPAYDVTPSPVSSLERRDLAMICGDHGRVASRANLLSGAPRFGLTLAEASEATDAIQGTIRGRWRAEVRARGGSEADCTAIEGAFCYPGFELP
jgi:serine/threonine-protein kinase HipA